MKKKNILYALGGFLSISVGCLFVSSCQDETKDTTITAYDDGKSASQFISAFGGNLGTFMDASVVVNSISEEWETNKARGAISLNSTNSTPQDFGVKRVYVDLSLADEPVDLKTISTPGQIMDLVKTFGAEISLINDGTFDNSILISEEESLKALNPLIQNSKQYLYDKGFSESEIQDMLVENNVDESALVPFVMVLTEEEGYQLNNNLVPTSRSVTVDWGRAGHCALKALGADLFYAFKQSAANTWSKVILKKAFKTIASKVLGPVGVGIAVIEFSICYWG